MSTESESRVIAAARAWRKSGAPDYFNCSEVDELLAALDALDREEKQKPSELDLLRSELAEQIAYAEGVDEHVSDMLNAMRPFAEALKTGDPISRISFDHWKTLQKAYSHSLQCLRPTPMGYEQYVCECGYHINDCHCGLKQQKGERP